MIKVVPYAPGAHIGESITLGFLREDLPGSHVILTNYHLPDDVRRLLHSLLASHPDDRPASAVEVKEWFELLAIDD